MGTPDLPAGMHVLERGWLSSNNILFLDGDQTVLVDSGYCTHAAQTVALVGAALGDRPLDFLVNTHLHSDHCGGNAALQARYPDVSTLIPAGQASQVTRWDPVVLGYSTTGQHCPQFFFSETLKAGTSIMFGRTLWGIHGAPGHDPHSVVFFEPVRKILISADALWENGFGVVFPELDGEGAFQEVAATLIVIETLAPTIIVPGHGPPFIYTPQVLGRAFQRLNAFVENPHKHARHAAKVLLKFKLLEVQYQLMADFRLWALNTPQLMQIRQKFYPEIAAAAWIDEICSELVHSGVASREELNICNA